MKEEIIVAVLNASEVQPNSDKRNEFLIVLDYLLHFTSDENHTTSQKKIMDYALQEYGVEIRRDRIPQILLHLYQLTEKYPHKFPFKLKCVMPKSASADEDGARRKYYISERAFTEKEILKIVSAIQSDSTITADATKALVDKFLKENIQPDKVNALQTKLAKKQRKKPKFTATGMSFLELLEELATKNERVWFKLKNPRDIDFDARNMAMVKEIRSGEEFYGHVYSVREINNKFIVIVYLPKYKRAFITPITNILITNHMDLSDIGNPCDFALDSTRFASIDEWVDKHYKGQDGLIHTFVFKFTLEPNTQKEIDYITSSFEKHWKKKLEYETKDREVQVDRYNPETKQVTTETIVVKDAFVTIETNSDSFEHWYSDYKILTSVVIVSPAQLNDLWLAPLVKRLARRITKYGARYDYELTRTLKPEYSEWLKQRGLDKEQMVAPPKEKKVEVPNN